MKKYFCDGCGAEVEKEFGKKGLRTFNPPSDVLREHFKPEDLPEPQRSYLQDFVVDPEGSDNDMIDFDLCPSCYHQIMTVGCVELKRIRTPKV